MNSNISDIILMGKYDKIAHMIKDEFDEEPSPAIITDENENITTGLYVDFYIGEKIIDELVDNLNLHIESVPNDDGLLILPHPLVFPASGILSMSILEREEI